MALHDDKPRVIEALRTIKDVKAVLDAWPEKVADLPTIIVEEARNMPASHGDDREYLTQLEYYIRIFTKQPKQRSIIASQVEVRMLALGYSRSLAHESGASGERVKHMRYKCYI
jgi:hypothetical protein